jgi:uncharacterized cupredoxin-like copper-binding protein
MSKGNSKTGLYIGIAIVVIIIIVVGVVIALYMKPSPSNSTQLTLYAGEVNSAQYGFGNSASAITSPGPTLNLKVGQSYTVTVTNAGTMPHAWEITSLKETGSNVLFGAQIQPISYLAPGASGSVTFTPNQAGNFYYICPVPGHVALGMWGNVVVTS